MMYSEFSKGIFKENPIFIILLGLCPTLAVSTQVVNALGMGAGVIFVLLGSEIFVSLLKDFIPERVRIPAFIVIIASFVTIVDLVMQAYAPSLSRNLGVFVQLIVVNCIILGRAEAFASKRKLGESLLDALGMGVGFTLGLLLISAIREILGSGTITIFAVGSFDGVIRIPGLSSQPARVLALAPGALLVIGFLKALFNWMEMRRETRAAWAVEVLTAAPASAGAAAGVSAAPVTGAMAPRGETSEDGTSSTDSARSSTEGGAA